MYFVQKFKFFAYLNLFFSLHLLTHLPYPLERFWYFHLLLTNFKPFTTGFLSRGKVEEFPCSREIR